MKNKLMFTLITLMALAITNSPSLAGQEKKEKSCAGGCCLLAEGTQAGGGVTMAMAGEQPRHNHHSTTTTADTIKEPLRYTCKMHPKVVSDKPGDCPKCGMELVAVKKTEASLTKKKMRLMMEGKYNCCIQEACNVCVEHGGCNCKNAVKNNKSVCDECYKGWQNGEGDVSGKTLKDIQHGEHHHHKDKK